MGKANLIDRKVEEISYLKLSDITANPNNPRNILKEFKDEDIDSLAESIKREGLHQAILVRPFNGAYQVVYGHRRLEAHKKLGLKEIKAEVKELSDEQAQIIGMSENWHRTDLTPIEREEIAYFYWIQSPAAGNSSHSEKWVGERLGLSHQSVNNLLHAREIRNRLGSVQLLDTKSQALVDTEPITNDEVRIEFLKKVQNDKKKVGNVREAAKVIGTAPEHIARSFLADELTVEDVKNHLKQLELAEQKEKPKIRKLEEEIQEKEEELKKQEEMLRNMDQGHEQEIQKLKHQHEIEKLNATIRSLQGFRTMESEKAALEDQLKQLQNRKQPQQAQQQQRQPTIATTQQQPTVTKEIVDSSQSSSEISLQTILRTFDNMVEDFQINIDNYDPLDREQFWLKLFNQGEGSEEEIDYITQRLAKTFASEFKTIQNAGRIALEQRSRVT